MRISSSVVRVLCSALLLLAATGARAESATLSLAPAVVNLRGSFGQSVTQRLTITNRTPVEASFEMVARDIVVEQGSRVFKDAGELADSVAATAVFSDLAVTVPAGEARSVEVTFTLPASTVQRAVIALFRGTTLFDVAGGKATGSIGTLFTFAITDDVKLDWQTLRLLPQTAGTNAAIEAGLENSGSEALVSSGAAVIVDRTGAIAGRMRFDPRRLLPGERGTLHAEYSGELAPGTYTVVSTLEFEGRTLTRSAELDVK